jgi:2-methylcitrate dehydratase PrpD
VSEHDEPTLRHLATFVAESAVPPSAQHAARRTLANAACLVIGSATASAVEIATSVASSTGEPRSTILGRRDVCATPAAAFVMGIAAHIEDFDDTHLRTIIHPGSPVPPAVLALGERLDRTTADITDALAVGVEVMLRVGNGMSPSHFERGWHVTATLGHIGAAAAGARLLGLDADRTVHAIGLALQQAGGVQAVLGTMAKSFHPGRAAMNGCEAALLAAAGWRGPTPILEGALGFAAAHSDEADLAEMLVDLGTSWELETNAFKPYSCGIVAHPLIDAGIALRDVVPDVADIRSIHVLANPWVLVAMGLKEPAHGLESKFSAYHAMAAGYLHGHAGPGEFTDEVALEPTLTALRRRITIAADERVPRDAAVVTVTDAAGDEHDLSVEHATGSVDRPMTDAQLREKGRRELERTLPADRAVALLDVLFSPDPHSVGRLVELATPPTV